jgi:uncharacterized membrane protein YfbV (UPF0208 family)
MRIEPMDIVPRSRFKYVPHILAIALLWSLVMTMDYYDQAQSYSEQLSQCLNGTWRGVTPSGAQIACWPAEINERIGK